MFNLAIGKTRLVSFSHRPLHSRREKLENEDFTAWAPEYEICWDKAIKTNVLDSEITFDGILTTDLILYV